MTEYTYIRVRWLHPANDYPVELWSELDENREELRKVEVWADGRVGHASLDKEEGGTRLGEAAVPPFDEIARDAQFQPQTITPLEFEQFWQATVR